MRFNSYLNEKISKNPIAYHGSYDDKITKFSTKYRFSELNVRLLGAYFTDNIKMAKTFGNYVYKVQLKFNKPLDLTKWKAYHADESFIENLPELTDEEKEHHLKFDFYGDDSPYHAIEKLDKQLNLLKRWKKKGYDGIIFNEGHMGAKGITYIPFNKSQITMLGFVE